MSLLDLANELLLAIKAHIAPTDLLTHVCFLQLCARTQACYEGAAGVRGFWRALVRANGLGLNDFERDGERTWRRVGVKCAEHAWVCADGACGVARLEENQKRIQEAAEQWPEWDSSKAVTPGEAYAVGGGEITPSSLLGRLGLNSDFPHPLCEELQLRKQIKQCAFIRKDDTPGWSRADLLKQHPVALRSFATFPFLTSFYMLNLHDQEYLESEVQPENKHGITVHDYLTALGEVLGKRMSSDQLNDFLRTMPHLPDGREDLFPKTWAHRDILVVASNVGSWFQLMNWTGISQLEGSEERGPCFVMEFDWKELPKDVREHVDMYEDERPCTLVEGVPAP
ncbi:hypothetical protein PsYK624_162050 [Phanerochaete sordida]|uniref:Uncharacterized protein n=1 Tax=Phanerochaete sordida TaxID=48140 RepID=A0A9P3GSZ5_9APHY|nr:hypothetical protein PsYK624_162050 [Phanerochaete sordida]